MDLRVSTALNISALCLAALSWFFLSWFVLQTPAAQAVTMQDSTSSTQVNQQAQGGQFETLGPWEVHYSAFASAFLQPEVAKIYQITRSKARGVINISVLDKDSKESQRVAVSGYALNALGQQVKLNFKRIIEQDSIYYIAQIGHDEVDEFRFFIQIQKGETIHPLQFKHTFYRSAF